MYYIVMSLLNGNCFSTENDEPIIFPKELVGVVPVYENLVDAVNNAKGKYQILEVK